MPRSNAVFSRRRPHQTLSSWKVLLAVVTAVLAAGLAGTYYASPAGNETTLIYRMQHFIRSTAARFTPSRRIVTAASYKVDLNKTPYTTAKPAEPGEMTLGEHADTEPVSSSTSTPLALPGSSGDLDDSQKLDIRDPKAAVTLDHLGPMVVNQDGSLSRISNWDAMSEKEKTNTMRILGKRNKERLEKLKATEEDN